MKKLKTISMFLCLLFAAGSVAQAQKLIAKGQFKEADKGYWSLFDNGNLLIAANVVPDYEYLDDRPWHNYADTITTITFSNITELSYGYGDYSKCYVLGESAFAKLKNLEKVILPHNAGVVIGGECFCKCGKLSTINFDNVKVIEYGAFYACESLKQIELPEIEEFGDNAFAHCYGLWRENPALSSQYSIYLSGKKVPRGLRRAILDDFHNEYWYDRYHSANPTVKRGSEIIWMIDPDMLAAYEREFETSDSQPMIALGYSSDPNGYLHVGGIFAGGGQWLMKYLHKDCPLSDASSLAYGSRPGVLRIYNGCPDFESLSDRPWHSIRDYVRGVVAANTGVGKQAFAGMTKVMAMSISGRYTIRESAFQNCTGLSYISLGDVYDIGDYAFKGCTGLWKVRYEPTGGGGNIGRQAFQGCTNIHDLFLGFDVALIKNRAFYDCTALQSVSAHGDAPSMGTEVFGNVYVENVPLYVSRRHADTYESDNQWNKFKLIKSSTEDAQGNGWELKDGILMIKKDLDVSIMSASQQPWYNYRDLIWQVVILNGVSSIGDYWFAVPNGQNSRLQSVTIPNSVKFIGAHAFENCTALETRVDMPGVTTIGDYAFNNCTQLGVVGIGSECKKLGERVFQNCKSFVQLDINAVTPPEATSMTFAGAGRSGESRNITLYMPSGSKNDYILADGWKTLGYTDADHGNIIASGKLKNDEMGSMVDAGSFIIYSDGLLDVSCTANYLNSDAPGRGASYWGGKASSVRTIQLSGTPYMLKGIFTNLPNLESVTLPSSVTELYGTFAGCSKLSQVDMPEVKILGTDDSEGTFSGCTRLASVNLPAVEDIGNNTFKDCSNLSEANFGSIQNIDAHAFENCTSLSSIDLGSVKSARSEAFAGCTNLKTVALNMEEVPDEMFDGAGLTTVILGKGVKEVGYNSFGSNIKTIISKMSMPPYHSDYVFEGIGNLGSVTVYMPEEFVPCFKADDTWSKTHIVVSGDMETQIPTGGTLGSGGFWSLDSEGTLTIDLNGRYNGAPTPEMEHYTWYAKQVVITPRATDLSEPGYLLDYDWRSDYVNVTEIELGKRVTAIGDKFKNCPEVTSVKCYAETPPTIGDKTFNYRKTIANNAVLHVLKKSGVKSKYEANEYWNRFIIVADLDEQQDGRKGDVNGDGQVNTADVTAIYSYVINGADSGIQRDAANVNGDSDVNTADVTAVYDIIIKGN